jgi:hypothetical protein
MQFPLWTLLFVVLHTPIRAVPPNEEKEIRLSVSNELKELLKDANKEKCPIGMSDFA